jgi:hypothetical protein
MNFVRRTIRTRFLVRHPSRLDAADLSSVSRSAESIDTPVLFVANHGFSGLFDLNVLAIWAAFDALQVEQPGQVLTIRTSRGRRMAAPAADLEGVPALHLVQDVTPTHAPFAIVDLRRGPAPGEVAALSHRVLGEQCEQDARSSGHQKDDTAGVHVDAIGGEVTRIPREGGDRADRRQKDAYR